MMGLVLVGSGKINAQSTWNLTTGGNWNTAGNWSPSGVPNSSTTDVFIDSNPGFNVNVLLNTNAIVRDLTIDSGDQLTINNLQRLSMHGNLVNNGLLVVNSTGNNTYFQPVGTISLNGSGAIQLTGPLAYIYDINNSNAAADHVINGTSHTIFGQGNIGFGTHLQITNQGLIHANVNGGTLLVTPNSSGMINTGTLRASGGGNLGLAGGSLGAGVLNNTGGTIEAQAGSTVTYSSAMKVVGGQLTGAGTHVIGTGNARFDTLAVQSLVNIGNLTRLDAIGTITNDNLIRVNSTGGNTYLQTIGTTTFAGTGSVELTGSLAYIYDNTNSNSASDHVINGASHTIFGQGNIGFGTHSQITNQGLIHANINAGTLQVTPNASGLSNTGTMRASNGGILRIDGSNVGGAGTFEAFNGSLLRFGSTTLPTNLTAGGVLQNGTWRSIDSGSGASIRMENNSAALINTIGSAALVELSGVNTALTVRATNIAIDGTLNTVQGGLALRNGRVMNLAGGLNNSGAIEIDGASTLLSVASDFSQTGGSLLLFDGGTLSLSGAVNQVTGGVFGGEGQVNGNLFFGGTAVIDPGSSPGELDFANNLTWDAGGSILFDLGINPANSDYIDVAGDLLKSGAGAYAFTFVNNGWLNGQTYDLIEFNSTNFSLSDFSFTNVGQFDGDFGFSGNQLQFTLSVVPEPGTVGLIAVAGLFSMCRRRRRTALART